MANGTTTPGAGLSSAGELSPDVLALLEARVPGIVSQLSRRFTVDQVKVNSGSIGDLDIDKIILGTATIENVVLTNTHATLHGAQAFLQNVRTVLELRFRLEWEVDLGWLGSWDGAESLGSLHFGIDVGNVSVPSLANINLHIPTLSVPNASAQVHPINNLDLGGASLSNLTATNTNVPSTGFTLTGMGVSSVMVEGVDIPRTSTEKVRLQEFSPNQQIVLPGARVHNLEIPAAHVNGISSGGFAFSAFASSRCLRVDLGILEIKLCVEPVIHMDIGSMFIDDAEISATADRLDVQNISVPVTVRGIAMSNLNLERIRINKVTL